MASTNYKEAFTLFDKHGTGSVARESLADLLRACGQNPTLTEVDEQAKTIGESFKYDEFARILGRPGGFRDPGQPEEYARAFLVFDPKGTGRIGVGQLRYILTNLGEKMSDSEVDEILQVVEVIDGEIDYRELIKTILEH